MRGSGIDSATIEWFGGGPLYSHVDAVLDTGDLLGARIDGGVAIRSPDYIGTEPVLRVDLPASGIVSGRFYDFLNHQLGKPYDSEGILAFLTGRDWREPDAWFCSELLAAALEFCGFFAFPLASSSNKITPPDLVLILSGMVPISAGAQL